MIPMYPKHKVYSDPNTEYSIEEIRAQRYRERSIREQMAIEEQEILQGVELMQESLHEVMPNIQFIMQFSKFLFTVKKRHISKIDEQQSGTTK